MAGYALRKTKKYILNDVIYEIVYIWNYKKPTIEKTGTMRDIEDWIRLNFPYSYESKFDSIKKINLRCLSVRDCVCI